MPRGGRKGCHRRCSSERVGAGASFAEYTIYDFANADKSSLMTGKSKKVYVNAPMNMVKELCGKVAIPWYEKDDDDFDNELEDNMENQDPFADEDVPDHIPKRDKPRKKKQLTLKEFKWYTIYPYDFWVAISAFIYPEDIGRFAAINHTTHQITHSAQFWKNLYRRYYHRSTELPDHLHPHMARFQHGLRSRVIKLLYILYPPYIVRTQTKNLQFSEKLDALNGARCSIMWHQKVKNCWIFYFKFQHQLSACPLVPIGGSAPPSPRKLLIDRDLNIYANEENGCCVLQVKCGNFMSLTWEIMGQVLRSAAVSVSRDMKWHKLKLVFDNYLQTRNSYASNDGYTVILDPVINVQTINWWEKSYPIKKY